MENDALIVEVVRFSPTKQCLTDPSLFQTLRDIVERWQEKGMKGQYWGTAVQKPNNIHWLLFWQSRAHAASFAEDPLYPEFVQRRQSLATAPVLDLYVVLSGESDPLQLCIGTPFTEVSIYTALDGHIEEAHETARCTYYRMRSYRPPGFNGSSYGVTDEENPTVGVYLGGWNSVEDHMRVGTEGMHEELIEEFEVAIQHMSNLTVMHVPLKKHSLGEAAATTQPDE